MEHSRAWQQAHDLREAMSFGDLQDDTFRTISDIHRDCVDHFITIHLSTEHPGCTLQSSQNSQDTLVPTWVEPAAPFGFLPVLRRQEARNVALPALLRPMDRNTIADHISWEPPFSSTHGEIDWLQGKRKYVPDDEKDAFLVRQTLREIQTGARSTNVICALVGNLHRSVQDGWVIYRQKIRVCKEPNTLPSVAKRFGFLTERADQQ